jgi:hypothetical protein
VPILPGEQLGARLASHLRQVPSTVFSVNRFRAVLHRTWARDTRDPVEAREARTYANHGG